MRLAHGPAAPRRPRLGSKEGPPAGPALGLFDVYQTQVGLVDQGRGLQRLARLLLGQLRCRKFPQFVVDQGQQLLGGVGYASQETPRAPARANTVSQLGLLTACSSLF